MDACHIVCVARPIFRIVMISASYWFQDIGCSMLERCVLHLSRHFDGGLNLCSGQNILNINGDAVRTQAGSGIRHAFNKNARQVSASWQALFWSSWRGDYGTERLAICA